MPHSGGTHVRHRPLTLSRLGWDTDGPAFLHANSYWPPLRSLSASSVNRAPCGVHAHGRDPLVTKPATQLMPCMPPAFDPQRSSEFATLHWVISDVRFSFPRSRCLIHIAFAYTPMRALVWTNDIDGSNSYNDLIGLTVT